jgi:diacylglycerol kinase (ATP)
LIGLLFNPISGRGAGKARCQELSSELSCAGLECQAFESAPNALPESLRKAQAALKALVVLGGDGTLMQVLDSLVEYQTPVYLYPLGNESLFSKEFRMTASSEEVLNRLRRFEVEKHYVAQANEKRFFSMLSVGFDSQVVKAVACKRTGAIRDWDYLSSALGLLLRHKPPRITLQVDSETVIEDEEGFLIIANTRQYAKGVLIVPEAASSNCQLHARFFPYSNLLKLLMVFMRIFRGNRSLLETYPLLYGKNIRLSCLDQDFYPAQADGEFIGFQQTWICSKEKTINVLI